MHDMLNLLDLLQDILRQDAILSYHVYVPHGPSGSELEQRIHVALQHVGLALNRVADRLHDEKQKKRDGDQHDHDSEPWLAAEEIA
jgi:hypothetical protein